MNAALQNYPALQQLTLEQLLANVRQIPEKIRTAVINNGGGVYNHIFYFEIMTPNSSKMPIGVLANAITNIFGSFENFKTEFKNQALAVFGSGYAWLVKDNRNFIKIITTANQNTPISIGLKPILTIDVWEHAYYLKHKNLRADYIDDWFNVVNWNKCLEHFLY